jgi:hypothetical protein
MIDPSSQDELYADEIARFIRAANESDLTGSDSDVPY